ncbi:DNA repair ATPase [Crateriforma conspicua]|uniref:ATPase involved in DNA repair n=1 Tax=Crateriforma conspicua TaxID=2527996 RepID=A0A5C5YAD4_9PLAN|nr:DNA repair ATPase [Crateriforma conspicua]TWT72340.1 ATPase involved in DNA repair [Crateriforma conspicua]
MTDTQLAAGTYEVLRQRIRDAAKDLRDRLRRLNDSRSEVFGNIETKLVTTERVTTTHNCVPRDLISVGDRFLFGYNVQFGLKLETEIGDVFSAYRFDDHQFHTESLDLIGDDRFHSDFAELYRFYKGTTFARFFRDGPLLHMVFRVGKTPRDIKSFKWRIEDDRLVYVDNRSEHEVRDPAQHEFRWTRTTRDQHVYGKHPHISLDDRVFVETVGGDLTIKIEDNTESGEGILAEPVENPDQTLDDAEVYYAVVGNLILIRIKPYQENTFRHFVFNGKLGQAMRLDEIEHACVMLPSDQGLIFPGGYYLQTGQFKRFDHGLIDMRYQRTVASPNGEDFLYLFYNPESGTYIQLRYNLINQTVDTPLVCHGQTFFQRGEMVCFTGNDQPQKHHAIQVWQTPFTGPDFIAEHQSDSLLFKIGNQEIVRGMSECNEVLQLIDKDDSYEGLYVDIAKKTGDILDSYFWIDKAETQELNQPLNQIRQAANTAIEEFEKVVRAKNETESATKRVAKEIDELLKAVDRSRFESIDDFVDVLSKLRRQRAAALALKDLRYVDETRVQSLETSVVEKSERISRRCVDFLLGNDALAPYTQRVAEIDATIRQTETVAAAKEIQERIDQTAEHLEMLTETVSNLKIDDTTKRTTIVDNIGDVLASVNRVRSTLKARIQDLQSVEGRAEFASQMKLLAQSTAGYLDICDTPAKCDQYLTKVMLQLEELEGRFAEFDDFIPQLATRREEIYAAFESRKVALVEKQNRRAQSLATAADRILQSIKSRIDTIETPEEIAAYFAGDLMVQKVRDIVDSLDDLNDAVRAEDLRGRLKSAREDAVRQLKDRRELYEDGGEVIRLGDKRFAVNTQPLDLTTVLRDGQMCLHLTGTQYFDPLHDAALEDARDLWDQALISENRDVYRGEYLAYDLFRSISSGTLPTELDADDPEALPQWTTWVQKQMAGRFEEGYAKGVHDHDAAIVLTTLLAMDRQLGLLRHSPTVRAASLLWLKKLADTATQKSFSDWVGGYGRLAKAYPNATPARQFHQQLCDAITAQFDEFSSLFDSTLTPQRMADYLFDQLTTSVRKSTISRDAAELYTQFQTAGKMPATGKPSSVSATQAFVLARNWADAHIDSLSDSDRQKAIAHRNELALLIQWGGADSFKTATATTAQMLSGIVGSHSRISGGKLSLDYHEFTDRMSHYVRSVVPSFQRLHESKNRIVEQSRDSMRLDEFKPRVLTSFVRNRLLDEVYLPLIGDNLAKQIGAAGDGKRTDRMGLLLLISPPGYGKTTLMEYIANRLGIVFMKINGPAIGHGVTSLDPAEAPNAAAREEVQRLNLALEMGDNVMLYLDDIQHTNPELLQKFISLCDATRKIEGVRDGKTRTYDLRGRRVAVVMAGNPYTESGERFQIPDMLSNRADVYNLGEIIGESSDAFEMSYLENCLTSNPTLAPLSTAPPSDARAIIAAAQRDSMEGIELETKISPDQLNDMYEVIRKLLRVRDVVLKVNRTYIQSAAQADAYRTEPPFKLQGSYRNMNRIAEKVAPVMNDRELQSLIVSSYEQDAQTLTTDNEANMLKFRELLGVLTPEQKERWDGIKYAFVESVRMSGLDDSDTTGQLLRQLASMRDGLESIRAVISRAIAVGDEDQQRRMDQRVESIRDGLVTSGAQLSESLNTTAERLEQIARQQATSPPDQKVLVQHKVPRVLAELVKGQFHLMQEWLRPILQNQIESGSDLQQLQQQLDRMVKTYQDVEKAFQDGKTDEGP